MNIKAVVAVFLLLFIIACQPTHQAVIHDHGTPVRTKAPSPNQALLSIFLTVPASTDQDLVMHVESLEILKGDFWVPVLDEVTHLEALEIAQGQVFLARGILDPGLYSSIRLNVAGATLRTSRGPQGLSLDQTAYEYPLSNNLELAKGDHDSLFINWDPFQSTKGGERFTPAITIANQTILLNKDLAYVACPLINTIYIIDTEKNRIAGSWGVPGNPSDLTLFQERLELYILCPGQGMIRVLEVPTGRVKDEITLPMVTKPSMMRISPDAASAFVLDQESDMLYHFDLGSGSLTASMALGDKPEYLEYMADSSRLAISSPASGKVALVDVTSGLSIVDTISLSGAPEGLLATDDILYITEKKANAITEYSLATGQSRRIFVGRTPRRLLAGDGYIYVANHGQGTVSLYQAGRSAISRSLTTGGAPLEMALSLAREWIYVCDLSGGVIDVIDLTTKKHAGHINLMAAPAGIVVSH